MEHQHRMQHRLLQHSIRMDAAVDRLAVVYVSLRENVARRLDGVAIPLTIAETRPLEDPILARTLDPIQF
jgi:hypothetical protein